MFVPSIDCLTLISSRIKGCCIEARSADKHSILQRISHLLPDSVMRAAGVPIIGLIIVSPRSNGQDGKNQRDVFRTFVYLPRSSIEYRFRWYMGENPHLDLTSAECCERI